MDRVAIFVDAGYLFAAGSTLLAGAKLRRAETRLDEVAAITFFETIAQTMTGLPLLRTYWYDGTNAGPTATHTSLANRVNVKVRLGIVNAYGEQKGVDSLLVTDLINLSRNRAMADAVLLTGDEDIRVGVQQAQELGVRAHLIGIEPSQRNQSNLLRQEADTLREVSREELLTFLTRAAPPSAPAAVSAIAAAVTSAASAAAFSIATVAEHAAATLATIEVDRVTSAAKGSVPREIDQILLRMATVAKGRSLEEHEKRELRRIFINACKDRRNSAG